MPPRRGIKGRNAHQPVHAALGFEIAIGVIARNLERDGLDARLVALQHVQLAHGKPHALAKAGIHAVEHLRPVLGLRAARARVQREHAIERVVFAAQQRGEADGFQLVMHLGKLRLDFRQQILVAGFLIHFDEHVQVVRRGNELVVVFDFAFGGVRLLVHALRVLQIVPKTGRGHVRLVFFQLFLQPGQVKVSHLPRGSARARRPDPG